MPINTTDITAASRGEAGAMRRVLDVYGQMIRRLGQHIGVDPSSDGRITSTQVPPLPAFDVTVDHGHYEVTITNPQQGADNRGGAMRSGEARLDSVNPDPRKGPYKNVTNASLNQQARRIIHHIQSCQTLNWDAPGALVDYPPSPQTHYKIYDPGVSRYWRCRSRYENSDFSPWIAVAAQTSGTPVVDPTIGGVQSKGNVPPSWTGSLTYTSTTTSVTWIWTNIVLLRDNGTDTPVANGSVVTSGLTAGTTYYWYPYYDELTQTISFATGNNNAGDTGFAQTAKNNAAARNQGLQSRCSLSNGSITQATPGAGTGGGGGGGTGECLRWNMLVEHFTLGPTPIGQCKVGDKIRGRRGWTTIVDLKVAMADCFIRHELGNGDAIESTPTHRFTMPDESARESQYICPADLMIIRDGFERIKRIDILRKHDVKVRVTCEPDSEFWAGEKAPSILTHNANPGC